MISAVSIREVEEYWDRRPCNIYHGTAPVGTKEWSLQVTKRKYLVEPHILEFAQFERWAGKDVLEIGCGIGTDTLSFLQAGARVDAVDVSEESLNLAASRCGQYIPNIRFFHSNAEDHLPTKKYDLVYSFGVLHHTPYPVLVLDNAYSALKPGGELRVMLYAKISWKNLFTRQQPEAQSGCPLATTYTISQARKLVEKAGFKVSSVQKRHIFPYTIKDYVKHNYTLAFPWNVISPSLVERYLGWHLLIRAYRPLGWKQCE